MFTWIPFYKKLSTKLLQFRHNRTPLVDWIYANLQGHINHVKDKNVYMDSCIWPQERIISEKRSQRVIYQS